MFCFSLSLSLSLSCARVRPRIARRALAEAQNYDAGAVDVTCGNVFNAYKIRQLLLSCIIMYTIVVHIMNTAANQSGLVVFVFEFWSVSKKLN